MCGSREIFGREDDRLWGERLGRFGAKVGLTSRDEAILVFLLASEKLCCFVVKVQVVGVPF